MKHLADALIRPVMIGILIAVASLVQNITEIIVVRTEIRGSLIGVLTLSLASALPELSKNPPSTDVTAVTIGVCPMMCCKTIVTR